MFSLANGMDLAVDWQLAYSQLLALYLKLNSDYQNAIGLGQ